MRRLRQAALSAHELESVGAHRVALEEFLTASQPLATLRRELVAWSNRGLLLEIVSVVESRAKFLDDLQLCELNEADFITLTRHAKVIGVSAQAALSDPTELDSLRQSLDKWSHFVDVSQLTHNFRRTVLDRQPIDFLEVRRALAECVRLMRGAVWSENLKRFDRGLKKGLDGLAAKGNLGKFNSMYARSPWCHEVCPNTIARVASHSGRQRLKNLEKHLLNGAIDQLALELVEFYRDDAVSECGIHRDEERQQSANVLDVAERACEKLRVRVTRLTEQRTALAELSRLVDEAQTLPDDPQSRKQHSQQVAKWHQSALAAGAEEERCDRLKEQALEPCKKSKKRRRNELVVAIVVFAVVVLVLVVMYLLWSPYRSVPAVI
jgi:hypothetical protein